MRLTEQCPNAPVMWWRPKVNAVRHHWHHTGESAELIFSPSMGSTTRRRVIVLECCHCRARHKVETHMEVQVG